MTSAVKSRSIKRTLLILPLALAGCGDWQLGAGFGYSGVEGIYTCSETDPTNDYRCGDADIHLCSKNNSPKTVIVTRTYAYGDSKPYSQTVSVPANANLINNSAPFVGRDEYANIHGMCVPMNYGLRIAN